ncbi:GntR family transcriptional regulator [Clostridium sp. MCC353]|uniref:GntR family transcriptional regulator n=1 Tax=Clostridium sp. MCC353 TaxID=2592646 RepID=UPI001C029A43|nr:GntR family transcriptional regulator [Clostridium sp. MCC353]MBT9779756.1 GntR family transcriptional regulator [Clostridium sp. MCC353]
MIEPVNKKSLSDGAKENLRNYIQSLNSKSSYKLPAENDLAQLLGISRNTIRRALNELEQEGLVLRIHGRGTFVNPEALQIKVNLCLMMEFGTVIRRCGYDSHVRLSSFSIDKGLEEVCLQLKAASGSKLIRIERIYYADNHPAIVSVGYMKEDLFEEMPPEEEWMETPYFSLLSRYAGRVVVRDKVELEAISRKKMAQYLTGDPALLNESVLLLKACSFDQKNEPVMYGMAFYDTDYISFNLIRNE